MNVPSDMKIQGKSHLVRYADTKCPHVASPKNFSLIWLCVAQCKGKKKDSIIGKICSSFFPQILVGALLHAKLNITLLCTPMAYSLQKEIGHMHNSYLKRKLDVYKVSKATKELMRNMH